MSVPAGRLPVLAFHSLDDGSPDAITVSPAVFEAMMAALKDEGLAPVGQTRALAAPAGAVGITFDDGYTDFESVLPILESLEISVTLYVPTDSIGRPATWLKQNPRDVLDRGALAALAQHPLVEIGSHASSHVPMDTMSAEALIAETAGSRAVLEEVAGSPVVSFAYPHGYWNRTSRAAVAGAGFTNACVLGHGLHRVGSDPFTVKRLLIGATDTPQSILRRISATRPTPRALVTAGGRVPWQLVRRTLAQAAT